MNSNRNAGSGDVIECEVFKQDRKHGAKIRKL